VNLAVCLFPLVQRRRIAQTDERGSNMNIYVGNLSPGVTEDELREEFMAFGEVTPVSIIKDRHSGNLGDLGLLKWRQSLTAKLQLPR